MTRRPTGHPFLDAGLEHPGSVLAFAHRGGAFHPDLEGLEKRQVGLQKRARNGDKEAIQVATLDAAVELFIGRVVAPAAGHKSPLRRLRALVEGWFDFVEQRVLPGGCMLYATCSEYRARPGRIRERAVQHREAWNRQLASAAREAKKMKELDADLDVEQLVFELTAFQSIANTAALAGDRDALARARRSSLQRIRSGNTA